MDIVIIGSGNVATVIGKKAMFSGHRILQIYSRDVQHADLLAKKLDAQATSAFSLVIKNADITVIAVKDSALKTVLVELGFFDSLVVHTAGAVSMSVLSNSSERNGVFYPLQSLRKEIESLPPVSFLIDGNSRETITEISSFAFTISDQVVEANDESRVKYHLAATFVNNFTNYLYTLAYSFCEKENISFAVLQPLMEETVERLRYFKPSDVQTGAAFRNDMKTIEKHKQIIKDFPVLLKFYELFSSEIQQSGLNFKL